MRDDPSLAGKPVVIGGDPAGRGVVAAASYEARRFGVHSAMPAARAVRLCPRAIFIRPDFTRYRRESEAIFAIYRSFTPLVQTVSLDEAYLDVSERLEPWGSATAVARAIRRRVREETRLTVSVGVGPNRLIAKIASDFDKPDGLTVVRPGKVLDFLAPLPVRRIHGVGPATEAALARMGVVTIADLREHSLEVLAERFGRHGEGLYRYARGLDERAVNPHRDRKSIGQERTYRENLAHLEAMDAELERLAGQVSERLVERGVAARTVSIKVRYADFTTITRAHTFPAPVTTARVLAAAGVELLRLTEAPRRPVRLLGVTASKLMPAGALPSTPIQLRLFDQTEEAVSKMLRNARRART